MSSLLSLTTQVVVRYLDQLYEQKLNEVLRLPHDLLETVFEERLNQRLLSDKDIRFLMDERRTEFRPSENLWKATESGFDMIPCTHLESLRWINGTISAESFVQLVLRNKSTLRVLECTRVAFEEEHLHRLCNECDLYTLGIRGTTLTDNSLVYIAQMLENLTVFDCRTVKGLTDDGVRQFTAITGCRLRVLNLGFNSNLSDASLTAISEDCVVLERLFFDNNPRISGDGVSLLLSRLPVLTELSLRDCPNIDNVMFEIDPPNGTHLLLKRLDLVGCYNVNTSLVSDKIERLMPGLSTVVKMNWTDKDHPPPPPLPK